MGKPKDSQAVQEAATAVESARLELEQTRSRLEKEKQLTDVLVAQWVDASEGQRKSIEVRQSENAILILNLTALSEKLAANVTAREGELRDAHRGEKTAEVMGILSECGQAADRIRLATREVLEAHIAYQDLKRRAEGARGELKRFCPKGELREGLGFDSPELIAIKHGPKLAPQLKSLELCDDAAKCLARLERSGALESDESGIGNWLRQKVAKMGIGPRPASFENTRVWKAGGKW